MRAGGRSVRRFRTSLALSVALLAAIAMACAAPASAQKPQKRFIFATYVAKPGKVLAFRVTCPPGWIEIGGTILSNPSAMPVLMAASSPSNARRRSFIFSNRGSAQPAEVRVRVTCLRVPPPRGRRRWSRIGSRLKRVPFIRIRPKLTISTPRCRKRARAVGPGIEIKPSSESPEGSRVRASVRETGAQVDVIRTWVSRVRGRERIEFGIDGTSLVDHDIRVSARCVEPAAVAGPTSRKGRRPATHRYPLRTRLPDLAGTVAPGINRVRARCPHGFLSLGSGFSFPELEGLSLFRSFPLAGRGVLWEIDSPAPAEVLVMIQAHCLDTRGRWR